MAAGTDATATRFGGRVALAVCVLAALELGAATGHLLPTVAGVGGALLVARSLVALHRDRVVDAALGSLGVAVGVSALAGGVALAVRDGAVVPVLAPMAVLAVGLDALVGVTEETRRRTTRVLWRSGSALALPFFVGALVIPVLVPLGAVFLSPAAGLLAAVAASALAALVTLQLLAVVVLALLRVAPVVVAEWIRDQSLSATLDRVATAGPTLDDVPTGYWYFLGGQVLLALFAPGALDGVLALLPGLGPVVERALALGVLHLPLVAVAALLLAVLAVEGVRLLVVRWAEPSPPHALAYAAGGVLAAVLLALVSTLPVPGRPAFPLRVGGTVLRRTGVLIAGPLAVVGLLVAVRLLVGLLVAAADLLWVPDAAPGFAFGALLVFLGSLWVGYVGTPAPVAFGVAAAGFVVWDVGTNAVAVGDLLGTDAATERGEFVHAGASALVGAGAVAVATVAVVLLGPLSASVPRPRAFLALVLALLALLAFTLAALRGE